MKKLLLSSVIMLGVCGIAAAQTGSKFNKKPQTTGTSAAAPTPQKAAIMPASDDVAPTPTPVTKTAADKQAAPAPSPVTKKSKAAQAVDPAATATTVNAAGEVVPATKQN